jgi:hypothetical protein
MLQCQIAGVDLRALFSSTALLGVSSLDLGRTLRWIGPFLFRSKGQPGGPLAAHCQCQLMCEVVEDLP